MDNLQAILDSVTTLDSAENRVLRDVLNTQLAALPTGENWATKAHSLVGLLSDDPTLADEILDSATQAQETRPLRVGGE